MFTKLWGFIRGYFRKGDSVIITKSGTYHISYIPHLEYEDSGTIVRPHSTSIYTRIPYFKKIETDDLISEPWVTGEVPQLKRANETFSIKRIF